VDASVQFVKDEAQPGQTGIWFRVSPHRSCDWKS